ncbi:MAG TPA: penicillin acylase family protein [Gemmatimonadaceae bacterium]|nr:penicillin acylase family protein [Gemmatimonadaceae bacterium]
MHRTTNKWPALAALILSLAVATAVRAQEPSASDIARWESQAKGITIIRDTWGIAHVYGKTDADAVFGMEYAQAEDDFNRIETNYVVALGRQSESEGDSAIWRDLRARLYADPDSLKAAYKRSPAFLKKLMDAFADGLNYYLYTHKDVRPRTITRFEPWMALSFTEGSIGGDIEKIDLAKLKAFYNSDPAVAAKASSIEAAGASALRESREDLAVESPDAEPRGSNGIAIAPKNTLNGHSLLYINPHTSHYFRSELQMSSEEGLNAYGAVTWGQIFIYQGFNERAGWMHTTSGVDNIDTFLETPARSGTRWTYRHGARAIPMRTRTITIPYRTTVGVSNRTFTVYFTRHGPIVGRQGDKWLSVSLMWNPVNALTQSYTRTKAHNLAEYLKVMELHTNSSNNTLYADADGNIAYLHSNYIPRRDNSLDWTKPVDGSDPKTDYKGLLSLSETPNAINPASGWAYNANNWPWSAAGASSPERSAYPTYVERGLWEMPRGYHALKLLPGHSDFTMSSLTEAGYDSWLPSFAMMLPQLFKAYDALAASDERRASLAKPIEVLRAWDNRWSVQSVATSVAVFWAERALAHDSAAATAAKLSGDDYIANGRADPDALLQSLTAAVDRLQKDFGHWQTPWGDINRFQRLSPSIQPKFDDSKYSIPVPFASARWGSLASFGAKAYPNTKKWYGTSGNSFVAVVEFGDSVRARAITAGGESGHVDSPHFTDQAAAFAMGALREVYFYRKAVDAHTERVYKPGQ